MHLLPRGIEFAGFRPRIVDSLRGYDRARFMRDLGAGVTVGIVALPLAMAFAIASGVQPEQGIFTAIVAGFIISALGGSQVQIGGPAGAFIVIVYGIVQRYGLTNLLIATALAGVLLFAMGWLRLGGMVRYIPVSIIIGFTNGIAVLIALSQVKDLLGLSIEKMPADFFSQIRTIAGHLDSLNPYALGIGLGTTLLLALWARLVAPSTRPRVVKGRTLRAASRIPGPIVALVLFTLLTWLLKLPVETIGTRFGGIPQGLPRLVLPAFSWESAQQLFIPTITIAMLGAIESLLCARVADNLCEFQRHDPNQELMAQGVANFVAPLFGGIPATGTIARTVTNIRAGATSPVSGIVHAFTLLVIVLSAAPLASLVPLPALAGILMFVAWNMGEWHEFSRLRNFSLAYRTILIGTFTMTVVFDLTVAVEMGLVMACVFFIYRMSTLFRVEPLQASQLAQLQQPAPAGVVVRELYGPLFFGAVNRVEAIAASVPPGTRALVLHGPRLISIDTSGLDALRQLHRQLQRQGTTLVLSALNEQPLSLVRRSDFDAVIGLENIAPSLDAALQRWREAAPPVVRAA